MTAIKSGALIISENSVAVAPDNSGELSIVARNDVLLQNDGITERQLALDDEKLDSTSGVHTNDLVIYAAGNGAAIRFKSSNLTAPISGSGISDMFGVIEMNTPATSGGLLLRGFTNNNGNGVPAIEIVGTATSAPLIANSFASIPSTAPSVFTSIHLDGGGGVPPNKISHIFKNYVTTQVYFTGAGVIGCNGLATHYGTVTWSVGDATNEKTVYASLPTGLYLAEAHDSGNLAWSTVAFLCVTGSAVTIDTRLTSNLVFTNGGADLRMTNADRAYGNTVYVRLLRIGQTGLGF
jgi:hypothetical protein